MTKTLKEMKNAQPKTRAVDGDLQQEKTLLIQLALFY
jgi:hypothetical protein